MQIYNSYSSLEIANIVKGKHVGENELKISSISYDTRLIFNTVNGLFIAFKTKKNNGHLYLEEAYSKGINCFIVEKLPKKTHKDANYIVVNNCLESLQLWAKVHRQKYNIPIIAITGSYGKTIVKEWIYHLTNSTFNPSALKNPFSCAKIRGAQSTKGTKPILMVSGLFWKLIFGNTFSNLA